MKESHEDDQAETRAVRGGPEESRQQRGGGAKGAGRKGGTPRAPETSRHWSVCGPGRTPGLKTPILGVGPIPQVTLSRERCPEECPRESTPHRTAPEERPPGEMPSGPVLILTCTVFMIKGLEIVVYLGLRLPPPPV